MPDYDWMTVAFMMKGCRTRLFAIWILVTVSLSGQTGGIGDPSAAPGVPAQSYALSGIDHVNYYNGNVDVTIPVMPAIAGRGTASESVILRIERRWNVLDAGGVYAASTDQYGTEIPLYIAGGNAPQTVIASANPAACIVQNSYVNLGPLITYILWTDEAGTQHLLYDVATYGEKEDTDLTSCAQLTGSPAYTYFDRGRTFRSTDGTDLTFVADADVMDGGSGGYLAGTLITRDGLRIRFPGPNPDPAATSIEDRNGNMIQFAWTSTPSGGGVTDTYTTTDPVGRQQKFNYGTGIVSPFTGLNCYTSSPLSYCDTLSYPGFNGSTRNVQINYASLQNALSSGESLQTYYCLFPELSGSSSATFNPTVVSSIVLADGTSYTMQYNAYGELSKLTLPTGGFYIYKYLEAGCVANGNSGVIALANSSGYDIYRRVQERDEYSDGVNLSAKILFSATAVASNLDPNHSTRPGTTVQVDFQNASGTLLRREKHYHYGDPSSTLPQPTDETQYTAWWTGLEFKTEAANASSTLQRVETVYGQRPCNGTETCWFTNPLTETAPLHDVQACQVNRTLLDSTPNLLSGVVLAYDQFNNITSKWEFDYGAASPVGASCPQTPTSGFTRFTYNTYVTQSQYTDPSVNMLGLLASTSVNPSTGYYGNFIYTYDGAAVSDTPGIVSHDTNYGTSFTVRGNPTTISRYSNTLGTYISTSLTYDIAGNVKSVTDQNGHATTIQYSDSNDTYAHPTQQTNALGQSTTATFENLGTGKITSATDANGSTTTYVYNDPLDRLTLVTAAAGISVETRTAFSYPSTTQVSQYQDQNAAGDGALRTDALYDGLGRPTESRIYESSSQYISTTQTYDALGRVATTTNPSRPGDGLGYATTYSYDSLGRQTQILFPDNSAAITAYAGNQVTATDQAGKKRTTLTDGLGRMTQVNEDPSGLNYTTNYTYDPLDNLTQVTQGTQTRTFNYDNLGWLTSVLQPEAGTISYTYDGVGNLTHRTDARSIQTTYTYDALNRIAGKTYTDGTPTVIYAYDNIANSKGYLTQVLNGNSTTNYTGFDALGRATSSNQVTGGQTYTFSYAYNRASGLTSETYPSGRVVSMSYDGANRASSLSGSLGGNNTTYANAFAYSPHGGVT